MIVLNVILLILLSASAYFTISIFYEVQTSNKFVLKVYMQNQENSEGNRKKGIIESLTNRIPLFNESYYYRIDDKLKQAGWSKSAKAFTNKRILTGAALAVFTLVIYGITKMELYLFASIPIFIIAFNAPMSSLNKKIKGQELQMKLELPDYLSSFAILLQSFTPYEATKKSIDYAGDLIRPHVEKLITDIDLYPETNRPYQEFASAIGISEAKEFMVALHQSFSLNSTKSKQLIEDQISIMEDLEEEAYKELTDTRPEKVKKYERLMVFPIMAIVFTVCILQLMESFSNL